MPCTPGTSCWPTVKYKIECDNLRNVIFLGRLAEYKYYNMDAIAGRALALCDELLIP